MIEEIKQLFEQEFGPITQKFDIISFSVADKAPENVHRAGVYLFYMGNQIWKIGKHNLNAFKRSREHFVDDTGANIQKGMKQHKQNENMKAVLFLLNDESSLHWIYALECFLELHYRRQKDVLVIPSARI
jgi:hypothetical protein